MPCAVVDVALLKADCSLPDDSHGQSARLIGATQPIRDRHSVTGQAAGAGDVNACHVATVALRVC